MTSGRKKEFYNSVILFIIRKFGILLWSIYEGNCVSKMFVYLNLLPKTRFKRFVSKGPFKQ